MQFDRQRPSASLSERQVLGITLPCVCTSLIGTHLLSASQSASAVPSIPGLSGRGRARAAAGAAAAAEPAAAPRERGAACAAAAALVIVVVAAATRRDQRQRQGGACRPPDPHTIHIN